MSPFVRRLFISMPPTVALLALCGYGLSRVAGLYVADAHHNGERLAETLQWRLPITMAAWGGGMVFLMELFRHFRVKRIVKRTDSAAPKKLTPDQEAEQLLLQLLEQNEAAQMAATISLSQTPPPVGIPMPIPDFAEPTTTSR